MNVVFRLFLSLSLLSLLGLSQARAATFHVATFNLDPMMVQKDDGSVEGIFVDIAREAFTRSGHDVQFHHLPFKRALNMLQRDEIDAVASFFYAPEREEFAIFPETPAMYYQMVFMSLKETQVTFGGDYSKLHPNSIALLRGSSYVPELMQAIRNENISVATVNDFNQSLSMLLHKRIDLAALELYAGLEAARKQSALERIKIIEPPIDSVPVYIAFARGRVPEQLPKDIATALRDMEKEGFLAKRLAEYFPEIY